MKRIALIVPLLLAACDRSVADDATAPVATPAAGNALDRVAALNPAQLDMVLFRALRDARQDCQGVTRAERLADEAGKRVWRVTCHGGGQFAVRIGADGIANVTAPRPARSSN